MEVSAGSTADARQAVDGPELVVSVQLLAGQGSAGPAVAQIVESFSRLAGVSGIRAGSSPRMQLLRQVWGHAHIGPRTVDVHVRRLRVKVGLDVPLVATLRGVGYRLGDDGTVAVVPEVLAPPPNR